MNVSPFQPGEVPDPSGYGSGGSPSGSSLWSPAFRCEAEWGFEREQDEILAAVNGGDWPNAPHLPAYPPFRLGIVAHLCLEAMYRCEPWEPVFHAAWEGTPYEPEEKVWKMLQRYAVEQLPHDLNYLEILAVEQPIWLWLDPHQTKDYGVVPEPPDAQERIGWYKALRSKKWRQALVTIAEAGPPYLFSSRMDLGIRDVSRTPCIMDHKSGHKINKDTHKGYEHSWQVGAFNLWSRVHIENAGPVILNYTPWYGAFWRAAAPTPEPQLQTLAWSLAGKIEALAHNVNRPVDLWARAMDVQVCRRIYGDGGKCPHMTRCGIWKDAGEAG